VKGPCANHVLNFNVLNLRTNARSQRLGPGSPNGAALSDYGSPNGTALPANASSRNLPGPSGISDALNALWMPACASVRSFCLLSTAQCYFSFPPDPPACSLRLRCRFSSSQGLKRSRLFGDEMQGRKREPATPSMGVFELRFRCTISQCSSAH
jgi:hypothetical protein